MKQLVFIMAVASIPFLPAASYADYWSGYSQGAAAGAQIMDAPLRRQQMQLQIQQQQLENEKLQLEIQKQQDELDAARMKRQERIDKAAPVTPQ